MVKNRLTLQWYFKTKQSLLFMNSYCGIWAFCILSSCSSMGHYGGASPETVLQCSQHQKWDGASWYNIQSVRVWLAVLPFSLCLKRSTSSLCIYGNKNNPTICNPKTRQSSKFLFSFRLHWSNFMVSLCFLRRACCSLMDG